MREKTVDNQLGEHSLNPWVLNTDNIINLLLQKPSRHKPLIYVPANREQLERVWTDSRDQILHFLRTGVIVSGKGTVISDDMISFPWPDDFKDTINSEGILSCEAASFRDKMGVDIDKINISHKEVIYLLGADKFTTKMAYIRGGSANIGYVTVLIKPDGEISMIPDGFLRALGAYLPQTPVFYQLDVIEQIFVEIAKHQGLGQLHFSKFK